MESVPTGRFKATCLSILERVRSTAVDARRRN
jgi:hypothetical protein